MRIVVAAGIIGEIGQEIYAHTKRSLNLIDPGYRCFFEFM